MKSPIINYTLVIILFVFLAAHPLGAMEFNASTSSELQAALSAAASNGGDDTIILATGTYYGNFKFIAAEANALTIKPEAGAAEGSVVLDGQRLGYVIKLSGNSHAIDVVFQGLAIQNGHSLEHGGGIYAQQTGAVGSFTIRECTISNNEANISGGGAYIHGFNSVLVEDTVVNDNKATSYQNSNAGGGISCGDNCEFINNTIARNYTTTYSEVHGTQFIPNGGGINSGSNCKFTNNVIIENVTDPIRIGFSKGYLSYGGGVKSGANCDFRFSKKLQ